MPATPPGVRGAVITGWGTALPDKILTNIDLEAMMDTDHVWIRDRTGISQRHVGGTTAGLSAEAGKAALAMAGIDPADVDALILATTTPDRTVPATSSTVQNLLGLTSCGAFDLNAACSGWVYALVNAHGLIAMGASTVLVIGTDTLDRITDYTDRNTGILFGNGSGAAVIEAVDGPGQMLGWDLDSLGEAESALYAEVGGFLQMEGKEVFRRAVRLMADSATNALASAGVDAQRHRGRRAPPGEHPHHRRIARSSRHPDGARLDRPRPNRQHLVGVGSARPRRSARPGSRDRRRPDPVRRIRRRHVRCQRRDPLEPRRNQRLRSQLMTDTAPTGRIVLVTGGSRGIGLACARRLAAGGDRVAVTYHSSPPPDGLFGVRCDVTDSAQVDAAFAAVEEHFGGTVEVLVSNAGVTKDGLLLRMTEDDFASVLDANLTASYRVTKRAAKGMLKARTGRIILMSSVVGMLGQAGQSNYAASKAGLVGFARSLARELGSRSITVNVVAPGPVATDMTAALSDDQLAAITSVVPLGRMAEPDEIAGVVEFLAGPAAAYITGAVIPVDGGLGMGH